MSSHPESPAERLRYVRKALAKMTQEEFASLMNMSRRTLIRLEKGEIPPGSELLVQLSVVYQIQPYWLLTGNGEMVTDIALSQSERELVQAYRGACERERPLIMGVARLAEARCKEGRDAS